MRSATPVEGLLERTAQAGLGDDPPQLEAHRLGHLLGDRLHALHERVAGPQGARQQREGVGQQLPGSPLAPRSPGSSPPPAGTRAASQAHDEAHDHVAAQHHRQRAGTRPRRTGRRTAPRRPAAAGWPARARPRPGSGCPCCSATCSVSGDRTLHDGRRGHAAVPAVVVLVLELGAGQGLVVGPQDRRPGGPGARRA